MRVKSFPEKLAKWECVDTQDPSLGIGHRRGNFLLYCNSDDVTYI